MEQFSVTLNDPNPDVKVASFFDVKYLRNSTKYDVVIMKHYAI